MSMSWNDIAMILFACTAANHLGLVGAIEEHIGFKLPIMDCCKCFSFWCTFFYLCYCGERLTVLFAVSFFNAYLAVWLELGMGYIDTLYNRIYGKIYSTDDTTPDGA